MGMAPGFGATPGSLGLGGKMGCLGPGHVHKRSLTTGQMTYIQEYQVSMTRGLDFCQQLQLQIPWLGAAPHLDIKELRERGKHRDVITSHQNNPPK